MGETDDWRNLPGFLEGLMTAGRKVKGWQFERVVRRMAVCGRIGVLNDCLRRVEGKGLGLWDLRVAREVMWVAVAKCVLNGWSHEGVKRGVKFADNVWEMMADPRHTEKMTAESDPKRRPEILGVLVLLHACRVKMFGRGEDDAAAVEKYAELMLKVWDNTDLGWTENDWNDANYKILMWAPVWKGFLMAQEVLDPSTSLRKRLDVKLKEQLMPLMQQCEAILQSRLPEEGTRRGLQMYQTLSQVSVE